MLFRSNEKEILDLGNDHYSKDEYENCLVKLDRIGRWLGGDLATFATLKRMDPSPNSILDVGCGGGLFTRKLALRYPTAKVLGIDINPLAIQLTKKLPPLSNLTFECRKEEKLIEPLKSYDVVMATLVCHHLTDDAFVDFISSACQIAKRRVIINDLHRHPLALSLFKAISPVLFRNRLIQHDGPLSIRRAFTHDELVLLLKKAEIPPSLYRIRWHFAFRWIIEITTESFI